MNKESMIENYKLNRAEIVSVYDNEDTGTSVDIKTNPINEMQLSIISFGNFKDEQQNTNVQIKDRLEVLEKNGLINEMRKLAKVSRLIITIGIPIIIIYILLMGGYYTYVIDESEFLRWLYGIIASINLIGITMLTINKRK